MRHDQTSYKRGFGCVTEHKLPIQLILVVWPTLDEEIEDMACKKEWERRCDASHNSRRYPFEKVSVEIHEDDE